MTAHRELEARIKRIEQACDQAIELGKDAGILALDNARHNSDRINKLEADMTQVKAKLGISEVKP